MPPLHYLLHLVVAFRAGLSAMHNIRPGACTALVIMGQLISHSLTWSIPGHQEKSRSTFVIYTRTRNTQVCIALVHNHARCDPAAREIGYVEHFVFHLQLRVGIP